MHKVCLNTSYQYRKIWAQFVEWCEDTGRESCPASGNSIASYVDYMTSKGRLPSSVKKAVSAIHRFHTEQGHMSMTESIPVRAAVARACKHNEVTKPLERLKVMCL